MEDGATGMEGSTASPTPRILRGGRAKVGKPALPISGDMTMPLESRVSLCRLEGDVLGTPSSGSGEVSDVRRRIPSETEVVTSEDEGDNNDD